MVFQEIADGGPAALRLAEIGHGGLDGVVGGGVVDVQGGGHALQPALAAGRRRDLHLQSALVGIEGLELSQRSHRLVHLLSDLRLLELALVRLRGVLQLRTTERHFLLQFNRQVLDELRGDVVRNVLALLLDRLQVVRAEERAVDVLLRRPDDIVRVEKDQQAHRPRTVEALAMVLHLDRAVGLAAVAVVLHLVPQQDIGPRDVVLEAFALVEEGHHRRAVRQRLLSLCDVERDLHHVPHCVLLVSVGGPDDPGEDEVGREAEDAEDLQELLRRVEVHDLVCVLGRGELVMEEVLARAELPL
mmetsp:Transcript_10302/g.20816  ORF Transcript_10302/g.20816 Transcript_10302/m.20816 type:complete len:302 (+) Transcript_10302:255-1160(+)